MYALTLFMFKVAGVYALLSFPRTLRPPTHALDFLVSFLILSEILQKIFGKKRINII